MAPVSEQLFDRQLLGELRRIELKTRKLVDETILGSYRSSFRGTGLIFSDLREYQPGDDIKHIHWKVTARTGRPFVKSYEEERSLSTVLAVDISNSTNFGSPRKRYARAIEFAALVALLGKRSQDAVGLCLFSDEVEEFLPPKQSRNQLPVIISSLLKHRTHREGTDINGAIHFLREHLRKRSIVFLVSDFYSTPFDEELKRLSRRHDVILTFIDDPEEGAFPNVGIASFQDAETGKEILLDTSSPEGRRMIQRILEGRIQHLQTTASNAGVDLLRIVDNPIQPLAELMRRRASRTR